jgi:hypothetical protein
MAFDGVGGKVTVDPFVFGRVRRVEMMWGVDTIAL